MAAHSYQSVAAQCIGNQSPGIADLRSRIFQSPINEIPSISGALCGDEKAVRLVFKVLYPPDSKAKIYRAYERWADLNFGIAEGLIQGIGTQSDAGIIALMAGMLRYHIANAKVSRNTDYPALALREQAREIEPKLTAEQIAELDSAL